MHFALPVRQIRSRGDDKHGSSTMPNQQFLNDKPRFHGLAEAGVICNQQVHAGHVDGTDKRIKLVVFNGNATTERREQIVSVDIRGDAPADGIQERLKLFVLVVAVDLGESGLFKNTRTWFDLPDDRDLLAPRILLDGFKGYEILAAIGIVGWLVRVNVRNQPLAAANLNQLARLWNTKRIGFDVDRFCH